MENAAFSPLSCSPFPIPCSLLFIDTKLLSFVRIVTIFCYRFVEDLEFYMRTSLALLVALSAFASPALALDLGDTAPEISVASWTKGSPASLSSGAGKKIYVLEFWATWCKPCRENMPHMSELQERFKKNDVEIIALSDEEEEVVEDFVSRNNSKMKYTVGIDDSRLTNTAYGKIPGFRGIPFSVIINTKGQIAWFGHPAAGLEEALTQMVEGTYDVEAIKKTKEARKLFPKYFRAIASGDEASAKTIGEDLVANGAGDPSFLNEFAWTILTDTRVKSRDLELALRAAKSALTGTKEKNAPVLDTYARALYDNGDKKNAILYQKKAVSICTDPDLLKELQETLSHYLDETD
jgi:thiol-disulfide isomerase/thioredoxin